MRRLACFALIVSMTLFTSCAPAPLLKVSLIGKWQAENAMDMTVEFLQDGTVILGKPRFATNQKPLSGVYSVVDNEWVITQFDRNPMRKTRIQVSGDEMVWWGTEEEKTQIKYRRVK